MCIEGEELRFLLSMKGEGIKLYGESKEIPSQIESFIEIYTEEKKERETNRSQESIPASNREIHKKTMAEEKQKKRNDQINIRKRQIKQKEHNRITVSHCNPATGAWVSNNARTLST
ncbi:hypothetical protein Ancab_033240 [Ancistrocladus abbreviatus]